MTQLSLDDAQTLGPIRNDIERRYRVWIVAHRQREQVDSERRVSECRWHGMGRDQQAAQQDNRETSHDSIGRCGEDVADAQCQGSQGHRSEYQLGEGGEEVKTGGGGHVADSTELFGDGSELHREHASSEVPEPGNGSSETRIMADAFLQQRHGWSDGVGWWEREPQGTLQTLGGRRREEDGLSIPESLLGRVADGIPRRVDRLRGLGNAIVPQIAEALGRMILEAEKELT